MTFLASILGSWNDDSFASKLFWGIGLLGLFLIILQAVFGVLIGHDGGTTTGDSGSVDLHGGHGGGANIVSIKTVSAMLLGFGFGGAILEQNGFSAGISALGGIGAGVLIGGAYFALMHSLYRLRSDGTSVLSEAINRSGTVYMRIPSGLAGAGEIQVAFGGRMQNIRAYTRGMELPTGATVRVVALHGDQGLLVEKLS
ncbi:MAG TPA: hypothetical protein VGZ93_13075 [Candidatus Methylacidiphilales bacterium]|nr:hypothetical protein [Candidatus Methylacidiphilales bacterium]